VLSIFSAIFLHVYISFWRLVSFPINPIFFHIYYLNITILFVSCQCHLSNSVSLPWQAGVLMVAQTASLYLIFISHHIITWHTAKLSTKVHIHLRTSADKRLDVIWVYYVVSWYLVKNLSLTFIQILDSLISSSNKNNSSSLLKKFVQYFYRIFFSLKILNLLGFVA